MKLEECFLAKRIARVEAEVIEVIALIIQI